MADSYKEKRGYLKRAGGRRLDYIAATKKAGGLQFSSYKARRKPARAHFLTK
jgi:hypothetical protein